jgi:hypothetical protein
MISNEDKLRLLSSIETCLPAIVKKVNGNNVDVEVLIKKTLLNGVVDNENKYITNVPLLKSGGSAFSIEYPTKENDLVLLLCLSRDSGRWKANKTKVSIAKSALGNTLQDFVAVPFSLETGKASIKVDDDGTVLINDNVKILL